MIYRAADFVADGSLRDISVLDTEIVHWQRMFDALAESPGEVTFEAEVEADVGTPPKLNAEALFEALNFETDTSARLAINVRGVWFVCHFFEVTEIEFTLDPAQVNSPRDFTAVEEFMTWLGRACGKQVIMSMEGPNHQPQWALLEFTP